MGGGGTIYVHMLIHITYIVFYFRGQHFVRSPKSGPSSLSPRSVIVEDISWKGHRAEAVPCAQEHQKSDMLVRCRLCSKAEQRAGIHVRL